MGVEMPDNAELAVELVRLAFDELSMGAPRSDEGKLYMAAVLTGRFMATIERWKSGEPMARVIDGLAREQALGVLNDGC